MYCKNCGAEINDGASFCPECGGKTSHKNEHQTAVITEKNIETPVLENANTIPDSANGNKESFMDKLAKRKALVISVCISLVLAAAIGVFCIWSFPLDVDFSMDKSITTTTGSVKKLKVSVKSNQPIKDISYAVAPKDYKDIKEYTEVTKSGIYSQNIVIPELKIPAGETKLYICVTTLFGGRKYHEANLFFDIGYVSAPDMDMIEEGTEGNLFVSNEVILYAEDDVPYDDIENLVEQNDGEIVGAIYPLNQYQVRFSDSGEDFISGVIEDLKRSENVKYVTINSAYEPDFDAIPKDSEFDSWAEEQKDAKGNNWGLELIGAPAAWDHNSDMQVTKVGVIDNVLINNHEDLLIDDSKYHSPPSDDFESPQHFVQYFKEISQKHEDNCSGRNCSYNVCKFEISHGTHVAGIIGAKANKKGICGVNWNSDIVFSSPISFYNDNDEDFDYYKSTMTINMSIVHCVMSNCRVINLSIDEGHFAKCSWEDEQDKSFDDMIYKLEQMGYDFLLCKSAGNKGEDATNNRTVRMLTSGEHARAHTIVVGMIQRQFGFWLGDTGYYYRYSDSNYGEVVDIMAPGVDIYSTVIDDKYENMTGTSMATPMVTGAASVIYSLNPDVTYDYVKDLLCNTNTIFCYHDKRIYTVLDLKAAVEDALDNNFGNYEEKPMPETPKFGLVEGAILEAGSGEYIDDINVTCRDKNGNIYAGDNIRTDSGMYQCQLPIGTYDITFEDPDGKYATETIYDIEVAEDIVTYNVQLNMVEDKDEKGTINGYILDAFDASHVSGASLKIFKGLNCTTGTPVKTLSSDSNGYYSLELEAGNYTVYAEAGGYQPGFGNVLVLPGKTNSNQNCTITPVLNDGEIRVVLTWNTYPEDLDSHMVGPAPDGRFHTEFSDMDYMYNGQSYCNLDVDDTTSYGPETTSVYVGVNGTYTFYVHDYTNRGSTYSTAMATSGAQVKVYVAGQARPKIFNVPNLPGTLWKVCTIKNGNVIPVNTVTYHENHETVGSDISVN